MNARAQLSVGWVYAALAAHALGFALLWPRVLLIVDEERYVSQAVAFASGSTTIPGAEVLVPAPRGTMISDYPPATSILQAPFVWAFGWRGASVLSVLALIATTLLTVKWLHGAGRSPAFALLVPGFLGAAFFGRVAMSDVPSAALVAATCYLVWRADRGQQALSYCAGLCAGLSLLFREPLILLLLPLLIGALRRRQVATVALVAGLASGTLIRLAAMKGFFGSWLYLRDPSYGFSVASLGHTIPIYALILLILFPGGALLPFLYRGDRRPEMVTGVALYLGAFLLFEYDAVRHNGVIKGAVLTSRYVAPLAPVLAFMAADVWPRLLGSSRETVARRVATLGAAGAVALAFAVHPLAWRQETVQLAISRAIFSHTQGSAPVVTNSRATLKYLSPSYGSRRLIARYDVDGDSIAALKARFGTLTIALLDRNDSEVFRRESERNARFLEEAKQRCLLHQRFDTTFGGWAELRVLDVSTCR